MKTILSLLFALTLGTAFGQFIPQPMGYNPDVNGDEFIGVDDVMGTLALYDSPFDNGDSVQTLSLVFSQVELMILGEGDSPDNRIEIPEGVDVLYLDAIDVDAVHFTLPQAVGFKSLLIMGSTQNPEGTDFLFYSPGTDLTAGAPLEIIDLKAHDYGGMWCTVLRRPSGEWLTPRGR